MAETEAVLLRRFVRSGDAEAFAEIIRRYAGLVYSAALRVLADVDRASDVAQETFLQLAKDAGTVTGSLPGWLHRVATHKAIDQVRRDATRKHREAEYMAVRPHETAEWKEISPYVDEGLNLLDPQLRKHSDRALPGRSLDEGDRPDAGAFPGHRFAADRGGGRAASRRAPQARRFSSRPGRSASCWGRTPSRRRRRCC